MIDAEWLDSLENKQDSGYKVRPRQKLIAEFVSYYDGFEAEDDDWDW